MIPDRHGQLAKRTRLVWQVLPARQKTTDKRHLTDPLRIIEITGAYSELEFKQKMTMLYHYSKQLQIPFDDALERITGSLKDQGFGVLTSIDVKDTLKKKLGVDFRKYRILGACNPDFAHKALSRDPHIGVMLPCNITVQEAENGGTEISAINPMETIAKAEGIHNLEEIAGEVTSRLHAALDAVYETA